MQLLREGIYEVPFDIPLSMSLLCFGMGTMLTNFHVWYYVVAKTRAVFNMLMRNTSLRGPMCFRCLILVKQFAICLGVQGFH